MLEALWDKRALLVSGKGGVGKTTLAAALALAAARAGRTVLLAELSPEEEGPSPLAALVGARDVAPRVTCVRPGLHFVRLSASEGHRHFLEKALPTRWLAEAALRTRALRRFLEAGPALREMGLMYQLLTLLRHTRPDGRYVHPLTGSPSSSVVTTAITPGAFFAADVSIDLMRPLAMAAPTG